MYHPERKFLFDSILAARPKAVLEVGTWKGGGSTWQIANALQSLRESGHNCVFHTCEVDQAHYAEAQAIYSQSPWEEFVRCHHATSDTLIGMLLAAEVVPDFLFFDGPEDVDTALRDFQRLDKVVKAGSFFMMHDWDLGQRVDGLQSIKALKIRPYLESLQTWRIISSMTAPESVGLILAEKVR